MFRWLDHRPAVGRFVAGASCLRRSPPQAAAGAGVRLRRHGPAGPGGKPRAGTRPSRRHAARIPALSENRPILRPGPRPRPPWASLDITPGRYVQLGAGEVGGGLDGSGVSGGRPIAGLGGFVGAVVEAPPSPSPLTRPGPAALPLPAIAPPGRVDLDGAGVFSFPARGAARRSPPASPCSAEAAGASPTRPEAARGGAVPIEPQGEIRAGWTEPRVVHPPACYARSCHPGGDRRRG